MKYYILDQEEEEILKAFEEGKLVKVKDSNKEKKLLEEAAGNTLKKTRNINIRLSEKDLQKLKAKAAREGLPYQTLAASLIHRSTAE